MLLRLITTSCLLTGLLMYSFSANAQSYAETTWKRGWVVKKNRDTLRGEIKYSLKNSSIQIKMDNIIKTYTPSGVISFLFLDPVRRYRRQFFSIPYARRRGSSYKVPSFFELIYSGKPITILSRQQSVVVRSNRIRGGYGWVEQDIFFLMDQKGRIKEVKPTKKSILRALGNRERALKDFIKLNRVNVSTREGLIRTVDYYNSITNSNDK
ncbi:MAG TPA: hypothetical protein DCS93_00905 [Microscillaceae bacterium]|nr:hypothetical protein [Microscillaceae bacterium]